MSEVKTEGSTEGLIVYPRVVRCLAERLAREEHMSLTECPVDLPSIAELAVLSDTVLIEFWKSLSEFERMQARSVFQSDDNDQTDVEILSPWNISITDADHVMDRVPVRPWNDSERERLMTELSRVRAENDDLERKVTNLNMENGELKARLVDRIVIIADLREEVKAQRRDIVNLETQNKILMDQNEELGYELLEANEKD